MILQQILQHLTREIYENILFFIFLTHPIFLLHYIIGTFIALRSNYPNTRNFKAENNYVLRYNFGNLTYLGLRKSRGENQYSPTILSKETIDQSTASRGKKMGVGNKFKLSFRQNNFHEM